MYSCFHSVGLPDRTLPEAIAMVADAGYAAIELNAETLPWAPAHITPEADMQDAAAPWSTPAKRVAWRSRRSALTSRW